MEQNHERAVAFEHAVQADSDEVDVSLHLAMLARPMPEDPGMSSDLAFSVGLLAGWLALVVWLTWPDPHCKCCPERQQARQARDRKV